MSTSISRRGMFFSLAGPAAAGGVVRTGTGALVDPGSAEVLDQHQVRAGAVAA